MNPASLDIKDMLEVESSLGLVFSQNLFIGNEPASPSDTVTIYDTGGWKPQLTFDKEEKYERPTIQIRVRNTTYTDGWDIIQSIRDSLHGRAHETWNGTYYSVIVCTSDIGFLDWDNNRRARFVVNFNVQRRFIV